MPQELPPPPPPSPYYAPPFSAASSRQHEKKYDERDYEEIYYHFDDYSQDIVLANASKFMTPPEPAEHYEWEELILDEVAQSEREGMMKSLYFGVGCGLLSFGMLRWRRIRTIGVGGMSKYASSSSSKSSGGYKFDPVPPKSNNAMQHNHYQQQHHHYAGGTGGGNNKNSPLGLLFDVTLTALVSAGTTLIAIESGAFYPTTTTSSGDDDTKNTFEPPPQWISPSIPLVPGRSIISDTLCAPLTAEFRKFPKDLWQSGNNRGIENGYNNHMALYANSGWRGTKYYEGNDNASVVSLGENGDIGNVVGRGDESNDRGMYEHLVLDSLQGFIINCERRSRHESKIRKIRGLRDGREVVIPHEGVRADEDLELDDIYWIDRMEDDRRDDDDDGFGL